MIITKKSYLLISILFFFLDLNSFANTDKYYGLKDKLSNSHVNSIYQDKSGFIWICTDNGLNVFDGSDFKTYYHRQNDSTSLINNSVLTILEDSRGNFWVGTTGGLQRFDRATEQFSSIRFSYPHITDFSYISCIIEDSKGNIWLSTSRSGAICLRAESHKPIYYLQSNSNICSDKINIIFEDHFGNIWIGSQDNGISVLNIENHTLVNYSHDPNNSNSISSNKVFSIIELPDGNILVGTIDGGIDLFDYSNKRFTRNFIPSVDMIFTLKNGSNNNLWIGTDGQGLKSYDYSTKKISTYESDLNSIDMHKAKIHSIYEDYHNNLWIALYQKGILMIPQKDKIFHNIGFNPFYKDRNIGSECILTILEDSEKKLWIGTDGDGIYRLNEDRKVERHYSNDKFPANVALSIFEDSKKRVWAGTYLHGLFLYDKKTDSFQHTKIYSDGREVKDINIIKEDRKGNLWVGTNENGLCRYDHDTGKTISLTHNLAKNQNQILSNSIHTILFSRDNLIWVGTSSAGLSCFDPQSNVFTDFTVENGKLNNNNIYAVAEDKLGNLWVGTKQGLHYVDLLNDTTILYTEIDGLANASICGIEIDRQDNLWITTSLGMSRYNTDNKTFSNYYHSDGLINDEFRRGAHFQSASGELFFGGITGLTYFFPFTADLSHDLINLAFTSLYIYNEKIEVENMKNTILQRNIDATNEMKIDYNIRSFSIGFVALEYNNPDQVIYQVKMDNFDTDWKTLPLGSRLATYTNLKHGKYTFKVRALLSNTKLIERDIAIIIKPPLWLTWWAKCIYAVLLSGILCLVSFIIRKRGRKKDEELKKENENMIMQSKLQFFTDISHEIRTPLTLILTPTEKLIKETPEGPLRDIYKLINQNGQRMLRLVNQVMEMRKLDKGQVKLLTTETNVYTFFREIISSFSQWAEEKNIDFKLEFSEGIPSVWIDREKLDKVIFNVLSNAFKYTPQSGKIEVCVDMCHNNLRIRIADSGEGIPPELRGAIFNRFYQIPNESNRNKVGTGIGLHLSRNLMEIHHGKIYVEDSDQKGAVFVILIPLDNHYLKPEEMSKDQNERNLATLVQPSLYDLKETKENHSLSSGKAKCKLLIVEDDKDIKNYLLDVLKNEYEIIEAQNGYDGLEMAIKNQPDCIITDVMMPEMDGIEMCRKIKNNDKTCHIPVIILTAKTAIEQRVEGLEVGADSYIPKPFNIDHLKTRIKKLIELRRKIKDKYEGKYIISKEEIKIKSVDEKFIEKLEGIIKAQIDNSDLSVETISQQIGISRSQLQRRLKQLTNQNPSDYLKTTRLRYAATLLLTKNLTISEVTYATGFSSLSHFSNSFREFYGMSPSRYMEINRKN